MFNISYEAFVGMLWARIEALGFTLIGVTDSNPRWVYSVGLTGRGWPEVIMIGNIPLDYVEPIMTDLINGWLDHGRVMMGMNQDVIRFADGTSHGLRIIDVPAKEASEKYACQVGQFYPGHELRFVQALFPDVNGKYPDEEGYDHEKCVQPIISED